MSDPFKYIYCRLIPVSPARLLNVCSSIEINITHCTGAALGSMWVFQVNPYDVSLGSLGEALENDLSDRWGRAEGRVLINSVPTYETVLRARTRGHQLWAVTVARLKVFSRYIFESVRTV